MGNIQVLGPMEILTTAWASLPKALFQLKLQIFGSMVLNSKAHFLHCVPTFPTHSNC